ncbi:hypothetical protein MOV08_24640 [Streptomyces yunnanensis]|uniref:Uncharacterized protein n=1 Tax=Streptomyces yunnanensis TaxID=156453 RepID=A0ABY8AAZ0_9ACTN|nr:hypothetical protein [Streptomyces yunnanensis]WEB42128.1 hypothetical protein MOV08_24640 [Streptomyces yunnanensis]
MDREEAIIRGELDTLREKVAVIEERLIRLTITRDTLRSLSADGPPKPEEDAADDASPHDSDRGGDQPAEAVNVGEAVESPTSEPLALEEARKRALALLACSGRPMKVRDITLSIGEVHARTETTRARLKRLAVEGRVTEGPTGWFSIVPADVTAESDSRD